MSDHNKVSILIAAGLAVLLAFVIAVGIGGYATIGDAPIAYKLSAIAALIVILALSYAWERRP